MACPKIIHPELIEEFGGNALILYCRYLEDPHLLAVVRYLLDSNGSTSSNDVNKRDKYGRNALLAFLENDVFINNHANLALEIVELLISRGSDAVESDEIQEDAIWKLFGSSTNPKTLFPIARLLLACNGVDINLENPDCGTNAPMLFVMNRCDEQLTAACKATEQLNEEAQYLHKLVELFVYHNLDLGRTERFFNYLLRDRAKHEPILLETVKLLVQFGANVNFIDSTGSPLLNCCQFKRTSKSVCDLIEFLIQSGADVNLVDEKTGRNALAYFLLSINSVGPDELRVISLLCERATNVNHKFSLCQSDSELVDALGLVCKFYNKFNSAREVLSIVRVLVAFEARIELNTNSRLDPVFQVLSTHVLRGIIISRRGARSLSNDEHEHQVYRRDDDNSRGYRRCDCEVREDEIQSKVKASLKEWLSVDVGLLQFCVCIGISADVPVSARNQVESKSSSTRRVDHVSVRTKPSDAGFCELIEFLILSGANVNSYDPVTTWSVLTLFLSFYRGDEFIATLTMLCRHGADVNAKFYSAVRKRALNALEILSMNTCQRREHNEAVVLLLDHGLHPLHSLKQEHRTLYLKRLAERQKFKSVRQMVRKKCHVMF